MPDEALLPDTARAPRFYPVDVPIAPNFHPELGYLAPSRWLRGKMRTAAVIALAGSAIAGSTALALMSPAAFESASDPQPQVAAASPAVPLDPPVLAMPAMPAPAPAQVPARAQAACDDLSTSFLAAGCRSGRIGKARLSRARAIQRLTTITIGRADPEAAPEARAPQAAAAEEAAPAMHKPQPTAVPAKPRAPVRTVRKERPREDVAAGDAATAQGNPGGLAFPRFVVPSLFGGADWARSR